MAGPKAAAAAIKALDGKVVGTKKEEKSENPEQTPTEGDKEDQEATLKLYVSYHRNKDAYNRERHK